MGGGAILVRKDILPEERVLLKDDERVG